MTSIVGYVSGATGAQYPSMGGTLPAMLVAIVILAGTPACAMICASRRASSGFAVSNSL